jgi:glycosyltransferase involved in cell wall biosynthesis
MANGAGLLIADMCGQDTGGQSFKLAKAITAFTPHSCRSFRKSPDYLGFPSDIRLGEHDARWVHDYLGKVDIVHAHGLYRRAQGWNAPFNPRARWVIHQHGRIPTKGPIWQAESREDKQRRAYRVVSTINLLPYVGGDSSRWIPAPIDLKMFQRLRRQSKRPRSARGEIWIAHSPTRRDYKGTDNIINAVETLVKEGVRARLILIEGKSHAECLRLKAMCNITYDQMHLCYGNSGLEGMAFGHATIVGMSQSVRDDVNRIVGYEPFCFATPITLIEVLRDLVSRPRTLQHYLSKVS